MKSEQAYNFVVKTMSVFFVVIGAVILGLTLFRGGGPFSTGVILGIIFIGIGALRYRLQDSFGGKS